MANKILAALAIPYRLISDNQQEFLLLQHNNGTWTFPGGGMDSEDKTLDDCLLREIKEEIGLAISADDLQDTGLVNSFTYDDKKPERAGKTGETHFYLLKLNGDERLGSWDKVKDHGWFPAEKIVELIPYEAEREIFKKAVGLIKQPTADITCTWINDSDLSQYKPLTQVYGICFNRNNEILIIKKPGENPWIIPGGRPEAGESHKQTLKRELDEEADVTVKNCIPLGVIKVEHPYNKNHVEGKLFYQARFVCEIDTVSPVTIDPDNGLLHERKFVPMSEITEWVQWGQAGDEMFEDAIEEWSSRL